MRSDFLTFAFNHFKSAQKAIKSLVAQELSIRGGGVKPLFCTLCSVLNVVFVFFVVAAWLQNQAVFLCALLCRKGVFFTFKEKH